MNYDIYIYRVEAGGNDITGTFEMMSIPQYVDTRLCRYVKYAYVTEFLYIYIYIYIYYVIYVITFTYLLPLMCIKSLSVLHILIIYII